jgi:S-DNA-T family DNA segregation ATPase FtsK/SpoIIIE
MDVLGLALFAAWLGFVVALLDHDPADPPFGKVFPASPAARNILGLPGAAAAQVVLDGLGLATLPLLAGGLVAILALWFQGRRGQWVWRVIGWACLVPAVSLLADWLIPPSAAMGGWSTGGRLGAMLNDTLAARLSWPGQALVVAALWIGGIGLACDWLWPLVGRWLRGRLSALNRWYVLRQAALVEAELAAQAARREAAAKAIPIRHVEEPPAKDDAPPKLDGAKPAAIPSVFTLPGLELLDDPEPFPYEAQEHKLRERAARLEQVFGDFGLKVKVVGINTGPVVTLYEIALDVGMRVNKVTNLADDLALNLKVPAVRVVAPLPNKDTVGIEIPNDTRVSVKMKEVIQAAAAKWPKQKLPLFLGKDTEGRPLVYDLAEMPHLLIAGRTGTGKSVCLNAVITSLLVSRRPDQVKMIMIDPKMLELSEYGKIPHLMHPVVKDMKKAEAILAWAVDKMEERYDLLSRARVRNIAGYNELAPEEIYRRVQPADSDEKARIPERMPYVVIFIDEFADLMMSMRKEVETHIIRLAQKSRAAGIHLVIATQKPTVDVITGLIKSNLPARICFQVSSRSDSRVVLDEMGAEKLLGRGDMLFLQPGTSTIVRAQGTYLSDAEITKIVGHLECEPVFAQELVQLSSAKKDGKGGLDNLKDRDELYEAAVEVVLREQRGSVSLLQRALGIGYGKAARFIDFMAEDGIVGTYNGSNAREVLMTLEDWEKRTSRKPDPAAA